MKPETIVELNNVFDLIVDEIEKGIDGKFFPHCDLIKLNLYYDDTSIWGDPIGDLESDEIDQVTLEVTDLKGILNKTYFALIYQFLVMLPRFRYLRMDSFRSRIILEER